MTKDKESELSEALKNLKADSELSLVAQRQKWEKEQQEDVMRKIESEVRDHA